MEQDERFRDRLSQLCPRPLVGALTRIWREALEARPSDAAVWVHGDLHPANILVREGRPVAVLDFGDLSVGDPCVDMSVTWSLVDVEDRRRLWNDAGLDSIDDWRRAKGWACVIALAQLAHYNEGAVVDCAVRTLASLAESP